MREAGEVREAVRGDDGEVLVECPGVSAGDAGDDIDADDDVAEVFARRRQEECVWPWRREGLVGRREGEDVCCVVKGEVVGVEGAHARRGD